MERTSFDEIYLRGDGVAKAEIEYLSQRLVCKLPTELEQRCKCLKCHTLFNENLDADLDTE